MSKRPYKSNCKTDEDTILNKAIGKKIKETRNNYFIFKKEIVDGEFRGTYKPVKKLITQTKLAKSIGVTFQQIQKYEKGTNGVSSLRLLQLSNYLKVPINYFFEDYSEYLTNLERSKEGHLNVNYNFLMKMYSELSNEQKIKFTKNLQVSNSLGVSKTG